MICPECGRENRDTAKFCAGCGTNLTVKLKISKDTKKIVVATVIVLGATGGWLMWNSILKPLSDVVREGATKGSLGALRAILTIYYEDHGRYPLTLDTQRHKDPKNAEQLRPFTDYIEGGEIPKAMLRRGVPNSESNKVYYGKTPNNQGGWLYDPNTGRVRVNSTYKDTGGRPYSDY